MTAPRRVRILGGMEPEATVLLMSRIITATSARDDADHVPLIVGQNLQALAHRDPGRGHRYGSAPVLATMARRLEGAGAEARALPCNTAYHDPRDPGGGRHSADRHGRLALPAIQRIGLFDAALARHGVEMIYLADQSALLQAIRGIKRDGATPAPRAALTAAWHNLHSQGAAVQLVACTEFSLLTDAALRRPRRSTCWSRNRPLRTAPRRWGAGKQRWMRQEACAAGTAGWAFAGSRTSERCSNQNAVSACPSPYSE